VEELNTILDQKTTLSRKLLELPGIERIEQEYNNVMKGKFIFK